MDTSAMYKELLRQRNNLIVERFKELYNINNWHYLKLEYVYSVIAKEFKLSTRTVKAIIYSAK
ncbi:hypothetical protein WBG78_28480 [Chryseolinea sp. T2]|uniref:hypothetical protein n=1 Tax=Chryseolinea sp. T2 TaxID=3129255 RepID=UPI003078177C